MFEYQNAQGDVGNARNIAEKFLADKVDLMAPCTTPSAQAAVRVARGTAVPVVFGCVTNPVEAGIVAALDQPSGSNVTGTYGFPPVARMFDVIRQLRPDAKRIGTIYNVVGEQFRHVRPALQGGGRAARPDLGGDRDQLAARR